MFRDRFIRGERSFHRQSRESAFQKGDLKYVILDLLKDKPRHGYEIIRELEEQSMGTYKPSPGAVYPTLQMFEDMGYTSSTERDGKKTYTITDEGLRFLAERKDSADEVRSHIKRRWSFKNVGRMAMVMKEYHALENVLGRGFRTLDAEQTKQIREILINARSEIENIIGEE
ncbi:MAG TPA: PadR family transcriptional regulator [Dehalococcoidia bacterium]|nr:PadR family transcriptional regulator [Dehalococcoidia bacterium]